MIARRGVLIGGVALAALPRAFAQNSSPIALRGSHEQGALVIGQAAGANAVTVDGQAVNFSGSQFVFGIAYDRTAPVKIEAHYGRDVIESAELVPIVRQYETQTVSGLPQETVTPSPEQLERIKREAAAIFAARQRDSDLMGFAQPFDWPFPGILTSVYGSRRIDNGVPKDVHLGVDIAAPEGTPIHAPADAVVSIADDYFLDGGFTLLDHGHGVSTCYLHQSQRLVKAGDSVAKGQVIGLVGHSGRATGPHTHWGLNWFQLKLDPSRSTPTVLPPKA
jgi:murein DD-endopeptidase MepM/ murein hydrolase activator NlpD